MCDWCGTTTGELVPPDPMAMMPAMMTPAPRDETTGWAALHVHTVVHSGAIGPTSEWSAELCPGCAKRLDDTREAAKGVREAGRAKVSSIRGV